MWIQVRTFDGKKSTKIDGLSKLTKIEDLRERIKEKFDIKIDRQRLFFSGKQLENGHTLFDYDVALNAIVQVMERITPPNIIENEEESSERMEEIEPEDIPMSIDNNNTGSDSDSGIDEDAKKVSGVRLLPSIGQYKINELVDAQDKNMGAWFEAVVVKVELKRESSPMSSIENSATIKDDDEFCKPVVVQKQTSMENFLKKDDRDENKENIAPSSLSDDKPSTSTSNAVDEASLVYHVKFEEYDEIHLLPSTMIRPRARTLLSWNEYDIGDVVMANFNIDKPKERGFWYDCIIINKTEKRRSKQLDVQILLAQDKTLQPCRIVFIEEIFKIEQPGSNNKVVGSEQDVPKKRNTMTDPECTDCNDRPNSKCKECGCHVCGEKKDFDKTLLCDECNLPFHTFCLDPPLENLPDDDDWYCPLCRNDSSVIVKAGEKLKVNKKKAKMKSATSTTQRDWGKGMACVGRSKVCTIVQPDHLGPIPGIPVGSLWKYRIGVSEAGVHRPHVSGIHGKASHACYSIVLAGGYEDDEDNGNEFTYTGSGGRDLSGNKRTAEQSCDQVLTKNNMSIARSCNAKINESKGSKSDDWKKGTPIRVVRNYKGAKHSKYAPEEGNRYDGIYKCVKYWPDKGKSGFIVWRYLLRRDDPEPAPWTKEGKRRAKELGLEMQYPDGHCEDEVDKENSSKKKDKKRKRESNDGVSPSKKAKASKYKIPSDVKSLIKSDTLNEKVWQEVCCKAKDGQTSFMKQLQDAFMCICCQDVVYRPVTIECKHSFCKACLKRSFSAEVFSCPTCRHDLGKHYNFQVNESLQKALLELLPGYQIGRKG